MQGSRIRRIDVFIVDLPLTFKRSASKGMISHGQGDSMRGNPVMVRIEDSEGRAGFGRLRPVNPYYSETSESMAAAIHRYFAPALIGQDPFAIGALMGRFDAILHGNEVAIAIIDMALHDLVGKILDIPLYSLLGGERISMPLEWSVALRPTEGMVEEATEAVRKYGVSALSLKIGPFTEMERDIRNFRAIRQAVGDHAEIAIDANESYDYGTAVKLCEALEDSRVAFFEQPLKRHNLSDLAALRRRVAIPILLDESLETLADAHRAAHAEAGDFVIKLSKAGGMANCRRVVAVAAAAGIDHTFGGNAQGNLLEAASYAHLNAALPPSPKFAAEFILGLGVVDPDPTAHVSDGLAIKDGRVLPPNGPGLGVDVDMKEIDRRSVASFAVT